MSFGSCHRVILSFILYFFLKNYKNTHFPQSDSCYYTSRLSQIKILSNDEVLPLSHKHLTLQCAYASIYHHHLSLTHIKRVSLSHSFQHLNLQKRILSKSLADLTVTLAASKKFGTEVLPHTTTQHVIPSESVSGFTSISHITRSFSNLIQSSHSFINYENK